MTDISKLYRINLAAQQCGVKYSTLATAVRRGDVPFERTACGLPLVTLAAVRRFIRNRPRRGRPRGS